MIVAMKLYLTRDRMQFPTALVLEEGPGLYEWSAASGLFVRAPWLEEDFEALRPSLTYEEIDERRALALVQAGIGPSSPIDGGHSASNATDLYYAKHVFGDGLLGVMTPRQRASSVADYLRSHPAAGWELYATYPPEKRGNAYAAANQIRSGRIQAFQPAGAFDAQARQNRAGNYLVHVRLLSRVAA
jgi:hypothetical protein